ncbi:MAG: tRNA (adenosine(37)-N6)-dimethylallyltransferase MiaA [Candidatus Zixiibacteriota bacterium]|nr:MAG: tRNA (adenosine(37)-N6)-dimethylallyltransferase MiaA [candidate division Zixibacteria bacterium]
MENSGGNKPTIPVLTGPTGAGKTSVALKLLKKYPGLHVLSADSRQIYKHLSIGTDKPSAEFLEKYNFHLVDIVEPGERYTAFDFVSDSEKLLKELLQAGQLPLICGGTGLYVKSLVEGIVEIPEDDFSIRDRLEEEAVDKGPAYLYEKLRKIDPLEAKKTHPNNIKRIIRALEIYHLTGKAKSEIIASAAGGDTKYDFDVSCLMPPRDELYADINKRVDLMVKSGLLAEVEGLYELGLKDKVKEINIIGYNELFKYFDGEISLESAINLIQQNTRRFAKRQITWFKGMSKIRYFSSGADVFDYFCGFWGGP